MIIPFLKKIFCKKTKNGKWKEFNKHAILVNEGFYKNNLRHGCWKHYYETGELAIEETYYDGELHGKYISYYMNGQRMSQGYYTNGSRQGYFHIYEEMGKLASIILFHDNVSIEEIKIKDVEIVSRKYGT